MPRTRRFFKVVTIRRKGPLSAGMTSACSCHDLDYAIGRATKPLKGTGILAFRSLECALEFKKSLEEWDSQSSWLYESSKTPKFLVLSGTGPDRPLGRPEHLSDGLLEGWSHKPKAGD